MKKVLLVIIIIISITFISCDQKQENESIDNSNSILISDEEIITLSIAPYVSGVRYYSDNVKEWERYLLDEYHVEIEMIPMESFSNNVHYNFETETLKDVWKGLLVRSSNYLQAQDFAIQRHIDEASILPLNEFLAESSMFETLPDEIKYAYRDSNGNIWALPLDDDLYLIGREIRRDWMETCHITEPNTLDELYEMMLTFTYNDPDQNGEDDTYGDFIHYDSSFVNMINFKDIFEANGCYLTYEKHSSNYATRITYQGNRVYPVGLNPDTGLIENTAYNPNLVETLNYIKGLMDANTIQLFDSTDEDDFYQQTDYTNTFGCHLDVINQNACNKGKYSYVFSLSGIKKQLTGSVLSGGLNAYLLTSSADKELAKLYIPKFVDTFYGTKDGYVFGRYGITGENYNYSYINGLLTKNENFEINTTQVELVGNLSWYEKQINQNISNSVLTREEIFSDQRLYVLTPAMMVSQNIPYDLIEGDALTLDNLVGIKCMSAYKTFIDGNISAEEFVEKLQQLSELHGLDKKIEEDNKNWVINN